MERDPERVKEAKVGVSNPQAARWHPGQFEVAARSVHESEIWLGATRLTKPFVALIVSNDGLTLSLSNLPLPHISNPDDG
jgi:hypothetical protein